MVAFILFVCTGNTCRSAMAEGLARAKLGPEAEAAFASAGLYALDGAPATDHAVRVAAEVGVDLGAHRARSVDRDMLQTADRIYVMARSQADALARLGNAGIDRVELLDPAGEEIPDPYGGDLAAYRRARDRIAAAVDARREEWREAAAGG